MDNALMEYACRIPSQYKLHGFTTKYIFKRAVKGLLPEEIVHRRKAGFMMPVARWLNEQMRGTVEDLCAPESLQRTGIFDPAQVRRILDEHFSSRQDHRKTIYALLCFMAWLRNHHL
jgi:asparagine synthase (glutamine-hydrolysing)